MKINKIKKLKASALESLTACWGECVAIVIVVMGLILSFAAAAALISHLLYLKGALRYDIPEVFFKAPAGFYIAVSAAAAVFCLLMIPMKYGIYWFFYQAIKGKPLPASCFFSCYANRNHFFKTIRLNLSVTAIRFVAALPARMIFVIETLLISNMFAGRRTAVHTVAAVIFIPLFICAAAFHMAVFVKYMFIPYIYISDPEADIKQIFETNSRCVAGRGTYIVKTLLSFIIWIAASILIFPCIFSMPYVLMTLSALAKELIAAGGKAEKEPKEDAVIV